MNGQKMTIEEYKKEIDADLLSVESSIHPRNNRKDHIISVLKDSISFYYPEDKPEIPKGEISDGYHTFNELYRYRMLYNAAFFNILAKDGSIKMCKSRKHSDGEKCFGSDDWFIVMAILPTGQISNHYESKYWDLFNIPEKEIAFEYDGHTPNEAADRIERYLKGESNLMTFEKVVKLGLFDTGCRVKRKKMERQIFKLIQLINWKHHSLLSADIHVIRAPKKIIQFAKALKNMKVIEKSLRLAVFR